MLRLAMPVAGFLMVAAIAGLGQMPTQPDNKAERRENSTTLGLRIALSSKPDGPSGLLEPGADPENELFLPFLRHMEDDQKQFWTSPKELRKPSALKTFLPFVGFTGALIAGDSWISKQVPDAPSQIQRSKNISKYAVFSLIGAGGGAYVSGHLSHNDHLSETGFLSGEAALNSTLVAYALKEVAGRERPYQGNGNGSFFQGGSSFPSEHAAVAWSIASVIAHEYLLRLIQSIGSNEIWAEYESGAQRITSAPLDFLTLGDMQAVQTQVPGIIAATPVIKLGERVPVRDGKERDILILGVYSDYWIVRNLVPVSGRFFDRQDEKDHGKGCVISVPLARDLYGAPEQAIGRTIKLSGLPFMVIGIFKERVDTLGQTEISDDTMVIPYSASRYLSDTPNVKMLYFSVAAPSMVVSATSKIRDVIVSRHRAESVYTVENLSQLVVLADRVSKTLTLILLAVAGVTLLVGGIGIMNIMLATVGARVQEVGLRKTVGATARDIRFQFLSEAMAISVLGGLIGIVVGIAIPFSLRFLTEYRVPVSGVSAVVGIAVSSLVGLFFGTFPAIRAARLNPIDSVRYE